MVELTVMRVARKAGQILRTQGIRAFVKRLWLYSVRRLAYGLSIASRHVTRRFGRSVSINTASFPSYKLPLVSIVLNCSSDRERTAASLKALRREARSVPSEVVVVESASASNVAACAGIRVIPFVRDRNPVQSVNAAAATAAGRYLLFTSADAAIVPGSLQAMLRPFTSCDRVGAVGGQIVDANGFVSEAGGIVWNDGATESYGCGRGSTDPRVCFARESDYCSSRLFMVAADAHRGLDGFSPEFASFHYASVDLCFRLRQNGYRVIYEPRAAVEALGCESERGRNEINTAGAYLDDGNLFAHRWSARLHHHFPRDPRMVEIAARRLAGDSTTLVVDSFIPFDDRAAGARRLLALMRLLRDLNHHVIFVGDDGGAYEPYTSKARELGVEVIPHRGDARRVLANLPVSIDLAWVSRPDILQKYLPTLRTCTNARVIYDTVDLHFLRMQRESLINGTETGWLRMRELEIDLCARADCTVVTSAVEQQVLKEHGIAAHVIPIIEVPTPTSTPFALREGLLFLANYTHEPNADAALWLVRRIMPGVWAREPRMQLVFAGADPSIAVRRLAGPRITVTDFVADVRPIFASARVFIAPLRYGAGMKGKVVQSLGCGVPVVTTSIGAEGIGLTSGVDAIIADDPDDLANAILRVCTDETLWLELARNGIRAAQKFAPAVVKRQVRDVLDAARGEDDRRRASATAPDPSTENN